MCAGVGWGGRAAVSPASLTRAVQKDATRQRAKHACEHRHAAKHVIRLGRLVVGREEQRLACLRAPERVHAQHRHVQRVRHVDVHPHALREDRLDVGPELRDHVLEVALGVALLYTRRQEHAGRPRQRPRAHARAHVCMEVMF